MIKAEGLLFALKKRIFPPYIILLGKYSVILHPNLDDYGLYTRVQSCRGMNINQ